MRFSPRQKIFFSSILVILGFILLIIGIVRIHYRRHHKTDYFQAANYIASTYDSTATLRLAQNPYSHHHNTSISLSSKPSVKFSLNHTNVVFPFGNHGPAALTVPLNFQSSHVDLALFPPKIDITTTVPLHPIYNTSTKTGKKEQDQIDKLLVENVTFQTTANPTSNKKVDIFCKNSSCDVNNMGIGYCTNMYKHATFTQPIDKNGDTILSCQQGVSINGLPAGFCGSCSYEVTITRYCQTVKPHQISTAVWNETTGDLVSPARWTWELGNESENSLLCHPSIGTTYGSGLIDHEHSNATESSQVEVVIVNMNNPVSQITGILWVAGFCTEAEKGEVPCFPANLDSFPSRSAGVALVIFGLLFGLIGLIFMWYYKLQKQEDDYEAVPASWRQVQYRQDQQLNHTS